MHFAHIARSSATVYRRDSLLSKGRIDLERHVVRMKDIGIHAALDDGGRLYVTDVLAHSVSIYKLPTRPGDRLVFLGAFGEEGRQEGQFMYPNGVAADTHGHLFVTDEGNNRIQVWGY